MCSMLNFARLMSRSHSITIGLLVSAASSFNGSFDLAIARYAYFHGVSVTTQMRCVHNGSQLYIHISVGKHSLPIRPPGNPEADVTPEYCILWPLARRRTTTYARRWLIYVE